jgi:hypothetical protein
MKKNELNSILLMISFLLATVPTDSIACFMTPPEQIVPYEELIKRSQNIALAQVIEASSLKVSNHPELRTKYVLKTLETLKGKPPVNIVIQGVKAGEKDLNFGDHQTPNFWQEGGRLSSFPDCQIYPSFEVGATYLVFLDRPYHRKSFERIDNKNDKWLVTVRSSIRNATPDK